MEVSTTKTLGPIYSTVDEYDTGWISTGTDLTNQHLGSTLGNDLTHNLGVPLDKLIVQIYLATSAIGAGALEVNSVDLDSSAARGVQFFAVDDNNIRIQTGLNGIFTILDATGGPFTFTTEVLWYKVIVRRRNQVMAIRNISEDYSTSETDTGKNWVDGKRIYRKVIDTGAMPNTTVKNVAHGITTIENLISISCIAYDGTSYKVWPNAHTTDIYNLYILVNATNVRIESWANESSFTVSKTVLEYTKV